MKRKAKSGRIFLDGRPLPKKRSATLVARLLVRTLEGDTLVVETVGFRDDVWLDVTTAVR
jgi:hypothetical protein